VLRRAVAAVALVLGPALPARGGHPTFSVDYVIRISRRDPTHAQVRWLLAGIEEIRSFRLVFRDDRTSDVSGTGTLAWHGRTLHWTPGGPYAHLHYRVAIPRLRPPGPRFDSWATRDWVATRALHLFPEINVAFQEGTRDATPRARLLFRLPRGWRVAAAQAPLGDGTFAVEEPGKQFARPRGWFVLGDIATHRRRIAGMDMTVAEAPGSALDGRRLLRLYAHTVPLLAGLLGPPPARVLVVSAPDPMWRGGLSGEDSFFVNGRIPLRSADKTCTYLHELFHVWQPFHPGSDGRWIAEGLAEFYSLALPHRAGRLSDRSFARGVSLFARYGRWGVDLSHTRDAAALNNSAPFVMYWLDAEIRAATDGRRSLDDVVRALARERGTLTTAGLVRAVNRAATPDVGARLVRHVQHGERPAVSLPEARVPRDRH
jgi:predicted metalloprotease with PDZ domain